MDIKLDPVNPLDEQVTFERPLSLVLALIHFPEIVLIATCVDMISKMLIVYRLPAAAIISLSDLRFTSVDLVFLLLFL